MRFDNLKSPCSGIILFSEPDIAKLHFYVIEVILPGSLWKIS